MPSIGLFTIANKEVPRETGIPRVATTVISALRVQIRPREILPFSRYGAPFRRESLERANSFAGVG
jgi:hypothetical protein